jgi:NAD(P)-dependent dehydrogenase (short-subunit alcohol dehydrogenase family)
VSSTICVVGAGGGIGEAVVRHVGAMPGTQLLCMDLPGEGLDNAAAAAGGQAFAVDLRDEASVRSAVAGARERHGKLDGLVLCSGIVDATPIAQLTLARWQEVQAVNLTGFFLVLRESLEWLRDGGRIVLLGSLAARTGGVLTGAAYAASKAGLEGLAKALARELAPRSITVNCVAPGGVDTPMLRQHSAERRAAMAASTPLRRMAQADEIAGTIAYLLGPHAGFVTGAVIPVNGGIRMD